jgi:hypothetical protein
MPECRRHAAAIALIDGADPTKTFDHAAYCDGCGSCRVCEAAREYSKWWMARGDPNSRRFGTELTKSKSNLKSIASTYETNGFSCGRH